MRKQFLPVVILGLACLCAVACTKTVDRWSDKTADTITDTLITVPDSHIIGFNVQNTGDVNIQGAIDDSAKIITIYLPYFYQLQFLEANITLPAGATISPAADELIPVSDAAAFTYTVTGKSGAKTVYAVHRVVQQPYLYLYDLSSADNITVLNIQGPNPTIGLNGINIIPSYSITSLHLIDADNKEIYKFQEFQSDGNNTTKMVFTIANADKPLLQANTDYWLEMRSYSLTYRMQYPVHFLK